MKLSTLRVIGLCVGNSPVIGEFPTQMASNAENDSIWLLFCLYQLFVVDSRDVFSIFFMAGSLAEYLRVGEATLKDIGENDSYLAKNHTQARTILRRVLCLELMGCSLLNLNPLLLNNI